MVYFLKWVYCADLSTGIVDNDQYAHLYTILTVIGVIPTFVCPFLSIAAIKKIGSVDKVLKTFLLMSGIGYVVFFLTYLTGLLQASFAVCLVMRFFLAIANGMTTIPMMLLWTECSDYAEYTSGRSMTALVSSVEHLMSKTQMAFASLIPGAILIAVGYSVNSQTGAYSGDLANLPHMISSFALIYTLLPAVLILTAWFIYHRFYPITPEKRMEMTNILKARREQFVQQENA